jgi:hypothetical protein
MACYINLTYKFSQTGKVWRGNCAELGTSVMGKSEKDVRKKLAEAIECHLHTLEDVGEAKRFFAENGIIIHTGEPVHEESGENSIEVRSQKVLAIC